jgi:hypothetical protein
MIKFNARNILQYLIKHPKSCIRATNITYAPKLFLLSSILHSIQNKYEAEQLLLTNDMLEFYVEFCSGYINDYYDICYDNNELKITSHY